MAEIKNIIFDFGGVLFDIDFHRAHEAFEALGFKNVETMYGQYAADKLFEDLEKGMLTENEFYARMKEKSALPLSSEQIKQGWNSMLLGFRWESLKHLEILSRKYRLFLLSNTNIIHYTAFIAMLQKSMPEKKLEDYFEKAWYSHEIHNRKPYREAYTYVLKDKNLRAEETLFVDDSFPNIDTAKFLGLQTRLLLPGERIESLQWASEVWQK